MRRGVWGKSPKEDSQERFTLKVTLINEYSKFKGTT